MDSLEVLGNRAWEQLIASNAQLVFSRLPRACQTKQIPLRYASIQQLSAPAAQPPPQLNCPRSRFSFNVSTLCCERCQKHDCDWLDPGAAAAVVLLKCFISLASVNKVLLYLKLLRWVFNWLWNNAIWMPLCYLHRLRETISKTSGSVYIMNYVFSMKYICCVFSRFLFRSMGKGLIQTIYQCFFIVASSMLARERMQVIMDDMLEYVWLWYFR